MGGGESRLSRQLRAPGDEPARRSQHAEEVREEPFPAETVYTPFRAPKNTESAPITGGPGTKKA
jgi:hypothetical protein